MFSFTKPLENLIGAAYLSGALEGFNKAQTLSPTNLSQYTEDAKHVRRVLLNRAESDGYRQPVHHIEEAKTIAKEVLNKKNTNKTPRNVTTPIVTEYEELPLEKTEEHPTELIMETPQLSKTSQTVLSPTQYESELKNEIMPLEKSANIKPNYQKNKTTPPPVLQLGGRKKQRKTKCRKNKRGTNRK